jgi:hypothetical protein
MFVTLPLGTTLRAICGGGPVVSVSCVARAISAPLASLKTIAPASVAVEAASRTCLAGCAVPFRVATIDHGAVAGSPQTSPDSPYEIEAPFRLKEAVSPLNVYFVGVACGGAARVRQ